jgi:hypothetical protein
MGAGDRAAVLPAFAGPDEGDAPSDSVPDPFGGSDEIYAETFRVLEGLVERTLRRLEPRVAP